MLRLAIVALMISTLSLPARGQTEEVVEAMQDHMNFAEYNDGIIMPEQIEWREVFDRIDEIPDRQKTILFCNTGSLSAQAVLALRVAGRENVLVLQSGFEGWQQHAVWKP